MENDDDDFTYSDDESENNPSRSFFLSNKKSGVIFLIDATRNMIVNDLSEESCLTKALQCCEATLLKKIITRELDYYSVLLYGTVNGDDNSNLKNIKTVMPLDKPNVQAIKELKSLIELSKEPDSNAYKTKYGCSDQYSLGNALWACSSVFSNSGIKLENRRILLFTCNDKPHHDDPIEQQLTRTKAKDLADTGIYVQLLHMGTEFDVSIFYQDFLDIVNEGDEKWTVPKPAQTVEDLKERIINRSNKKLRLCKLKWDLGQGVSLGVGLYNLYRKETVPLKENLHRTTNEPLQSVRQYLHGEYGNLLLMSDLVYVLKRGNENIEFTPEERKRVNFITEPGITLLGFKPDSAIKVEHQYKPASFIYPEEDVVEGSTQLFVALLEKCLELKKVIVCSISAGRHRHPYIVHLKPQREIVDMETGTQICPSGFHLFYLPFSDCFRDIPMEDSPDVTRDQIDIAKKIIRKIRFNYDPRNFQNPKIETHWVNMEALALEYDEPRSVQDNTVPDLEHIDKRLNELDVAFLNSVFSNTYNPEKTIVTSGKRTMDSPRASRAKVPKQAVSKEIGKLVDEKKVESLTVNQLKMHLSNYPDVRTSGLKKASLVELVYKLYSTKSDE